jgi:hypothetical protein
MRLLAPRILAGLFSFLQEEPMFTLDDTPAAELDKLGDELTNEIPEPQQHAIDQAISDASKNPDIPGAAPGSVELDALGIPWNAAEHATGADGKGVRTAKGTWRKRRGLKGSPSHLNTGAANANSPADKEAEQAAINAQTAEKQNRMAGAMAGTMLVRISAAVGGQEFLPRTITVPGGLTYNEEQFLQQAFGDYFVAKGISDIPPGLVLCSALMMYYMPRFQSPEVRQRGGRVAGWFKDKFTRAYIWFKYRGKKKPESKHVEPKEPMTARDYIRERQENADTNGARGGSRFGGAAHSPVHMENPASDDDEQHRT